MIPSAFLLPLPLPNAASRATTPRRQRARTNSSSQRRQLVQQKSFPYASLNLSFPPPSPRRTRRSNRHSDYHANVGSVIDSLRIFYPRLLHSEPDLTHFSRAIVFADSTGYRVVGHEAYRAAFWMLRAQARVFWQSWVVEMQSLFYDDCEGAVYVRWRITANARMWGGVVWDGVSVYVFDERGKVVVHQLENGVRNKRGVWIRGGVPAGVGGHWVGGLESRKREREKEKVGGVK